MKMEINKARLAAGDRNELLKLARTIKATVPASENHPLAAQFFDDEPAGVRQLDTDELVSSLAGEPFNERSREIEAEVFAQRAREQMGVGGMTKPTASADVSRIGIGSGWTAPKPTITSGAKAERALLLNKLAKAANPYAADTAILVETLKSIVHQLLGVSVENFDASTLKSKLATALKTARPELSKRLTKALAIASPDSDVSLEELIRLGAKVTKTGNTLNISV